MMPIFLLCFFFLILSRYAYLTTDWVELVKRGDNAKIPNEYNFSQTMLRVKDPQKSIAFYQKLGMKVLREAHYPEAKFSLYFLASSNVPDDADPKTMFAPVLELTHNHGTENDESFQYYNGNEEGRQGFGHIGFLVDDVYAACDALRPLGYGFRKVRKAFQKNKQEILTWRDCCLLLRSVHLFSLDLYQICKRA